VDSQPITLSKDELKELMEEAVHDAFTKMGIDASDPLEMQRDFSHLREWRKSVDTVRSKSLLTVVGIFIAGAAAALWIGFKAAVQTGSTP